MSLCYYEILHMHIFVVIVSLIRSQTKQRSEYYTPSASNTLHEQIFRSYLLYTLTCVKVNYILSGALIPKRLRAFLMTRAVAEVSKMRNCFCSFVSACKTE